LRRTESHGGGRARIDYEEEGKFGRYGIKIHSKVKSFKESCMIDVSYYSRVFVPKKWEK